VWWSTRRYVLLFTFAFSFHPPNPLKLQSYSGINAPLKALTRTDGLKLTSPNHHPHLLCRHLSYPSVPLHFLGLKALLCLPRASRNILSLPPTHALLSPSNKIPSASMLSCQLPMSYHPPTLLSSPRSMAPYSNPRKLWRVSIVISALRHSRQMQPSILTQQMPLEGATCAGHVSLKMVGLAETA
jgi:hypothetical protein